MSEVPNTVTEKVDLSVELFKAYYTDVVKFYTKGTASAAARARKNLSKITKLAKEIRKEVQTDKKAKIAERKAAKGVSVTSL